MKAKLLVLIGATALACLSLPPQATAVSDDEQSPRDRDTMRFQGTPHLGELRRAGHIIGAEIQDDQGKRIGRVKDLALDLQNGRIAEVIVAMGTSMDLPAKIIALPPESIALGSDMKSLRLWTDKAKLNSAPEFPISRWVECTTATPVKDVYERFGVEAYFKSEADQSSSAPQSAPQPGQDTQYYHFNGENALPHLGYVARATSLMGASAFDLKNDKLARVHDFMVDLPGGHVVEVILAEGGFLGMGREFTAVPPESFRWNADNTALTLDTTRAELLSAPHFKSSQWNYANEPGRVLQVYSLYHVEPYFVIAESNQGAQNVRERTDNAPATLQQGNNADMETTEQIRKAVLANGSMSDDAKKVQIVTSDGKVTLIGKVNTAEEKRLIGEAAAKVAGLDKVDNQIEIRSIPDATLPILPQ